MRVTNLMMQPLTIKLERPNAIATLQNAYLGRYALKIGKRTYITELWVFGAPARDEAEWLSFYNGDAHDRSKCQLRDIATGKFYNLDVS